PRRTHPPPSLRRGLHLLRRPPRAVPTRSRSMTPTLPALLVLTDRHQLPAGRSLVDQVARCVAGGARAVVLREKDLPCDERAALAATLAREVHAAGGMLLVASDPTLPADGVHLAARDPAPGHQPGLVGRSCHSVADL